MADILVVDDEQSIATAFERFLRDEGHRCRIASSGDDALRLMEDRSPDMVFMDVRMPGRSGLEGLQEIRRRFPDVQVVIMTAYGSSQTSIDAIRGGAFDYLSKPLDLDELRTVIGKALAAQRVRSAAAGGVEAGVTQGVRLVGETAAIREVYKLIGRIATTDAPALVVGERGTGKQLVTRTIHDNSRRREAPFVSIDCAISRESAIEAALLASEAGTLHLASVERLPLPLQTTVTGLVTADHASQRTTAPRVIASSEHELAEETRSGAFSRELYDALSVIVVRLSPLRDRRDDIPLLVHYFIGRFNNELSRSIKGVDPDVWRRLQQHQWPGNIGELERAIKRACIIARSDVITLDEIGEALAESRFDRSEVESALSRTVRTALHERLLERSGARPSLPFHDIVDLVELTLVDEALAITKGNQVKAAEILGVNRATLRKKIPPDQSS
jgi:DNA-binding NtrC family response regulator